MSVEPRYLSLEEAARYISMPPNTLRALVRDRRIKVIRRARRLKFDRLWLDEWMERGAEEPIRED